MKKINEKPAFSNIAKIYREKLIIWRKRNMEIWRGGEEEMSNEAMAWP